MAYKVFLKGGNVADVKCDYFHIGKEFYTFSDDLDFKNSDKGGKSKTKIIDLPAFFQILEVQGIVKN